MLGTILTILASIALARLSFLWWRSYLNPVMLGVLAWTPAMVMLNWPQMFVAPRYIHQNREMSDLAYYAMGMAFLSFWAGCAVVKAISPVGTFPHRLPEIRLNVVEWRLFACFAVGLGIFVYAYLTSGLIDLTYLDEQQVAASRLALHIGPLSILQILMDIAAIGFFARFLQTGRWLFTLPLLISFAAYGLTLQKSLIVWILSAAVFAAALHPREFYRLMLRRLWTRLLVVLAAVGSVVLLAATNTARGISAVALTAAPHSLIEQLYIYSGATAIKNLSVTLEGYLPSDGPTMGAYLVRPILWQFVDRDLFDSGRYLEGVNAATYLIVAWIDFRWAGFLITPFLTGAAIMLFLRAAFSGSLAGLIFGAVAIRATIFTIGTDVIFEPVTWYTLILAVIAGAVSRRYTSRYRPAPRVGAGRGLVGAMSAVRPPLSGGRGA